MCEGIMYVCKQARYIVTILLQLVYYSQAKYRISQNATSWNTPSTCTVATPDIQFGSKPGEYLINDSNRLLTPEMTSLWIGYYQVPVGFEYIGCITKDNIGNLDDVTQQPINGDPGECFLGCSSASIIAVSDKECYCLNENYHNITERTSTRCMTRCSPVLRVACGGTSGHLSVYRVISNVTKQEIKKSEQQSSQPKICLTFNPPQNNFIWDDCIKSLSGMCVYGKRTTELPHQDYKDWIETSTACFKQGSMPVPYLINPQWQFIQSTGVFWTGIFKTYATFKIHDVPGWVDFTADDIKYGMLEYNTSDTNHYLHFVDKDVTIKKSLCKSDAGDITTPWGTTAINIVPDSRKDKSGNNKLPTDPTISDANSTQTETSPKQPVSNDNMVIGVVVGVVLFFVVILIIAAIILMKRRGNRCCSCVKEKPATTIDEKTGSGIGNANDNHAYFSLEPHGLEQTENTCDVDYNYVDVETSNNAGIENKADDKSNIGKPTPESNPDVDTYDTTTEVNKGRESGEGNIYNKMSSSDNTYSTTTHTVTQKSTNQTTDDVYNELGGNNEETYDSTTSRRHEYTDDIYDKTSPVPDDTYSHLQNSNKLVNKQTVHTDNVYGSAT